MVFSIHKVKQPLCYAVLCRSVMSDSATPWTVARQTPLPMRIPQAWILESIAMLSSRDLSVPGLNPGLPHFSGFFTIWATREAREWVAYPFSSGPFWPRSRTGSPALQVDSLPPELPGKPQTTIQFSSVQSLSRVRLFATPWIAARQASLSITNLKQPLPVSNSRMFSSPEKETLQPPSLFCFIPISSHSPFLPFLNPWKPVIYLGSLWICLFWIFNTNGIIQYVVFCIWILSFSIMFPRFILTVACIDTSSFWWLNNMGLYGYTTFCLSVYH